MSNGASTGRFPTRAVTVALGLVLLAALGAGAFAAVGGGATGEPPGRLPEAEILSRLTAAPEKTPPFRATVAVEQTLVPEGLIGASEGDTGGSGPKTARVWRGGPDTSRAELQGENGDTVVVRNGNKVSLYDGATNTLKTGEKPPEADSGADTPPEAQAASPEQVEDFLAKIAPTSDLAAGAPVVDAGRWAYPLTLTPKDRDQTLVERAQTLVDAETFVPLRFELYAEGVPEPVARYETQSFEVGPVPDERFELAPPPGATVESLNPEGDGRAEGDRGTTEQPRKVASIEEAGDLAGFAVKGLPQAPGGRKLEEITATEGGAALRYGSGWGTVVLTEKPDESGSGSAEPREGTDQEQQAQVPAVGLGNGVEAREVSTPVGTVLSWSAGGVSYTLAGSVTAADLEAAARGLVR